MEVMAEGTLQSIVSLFNKRDKSIVSCNSINSVKVIRIPI
jgi:hypothetical protein